MLQNATGDNKEKHMPDLVLAARTAAVPFEASPTGRWVRFEGEGHSVYVVRDAWAEGCVLLAANGEDNAQVSRFLRPQEAVAAAVRLVRGEEAGLLLSA